MAYGKEEVGISIASALLEAGANVEAVDAKNNTALHYAAGCAPAHAAPVHRSSRFACCPPLAASKLHLA